MAEPKHEIEMVRYAAAALLAAVEIHNKPTVEYREQTVALLLINAWEVLLKARLVQQAGGKIDVIYRRRTGSTEYVTGRQMIFTHGATMPPPAKLNEYNHAELPVTCLSERP